MNRVWEKTHKCSQMIFCGGTRVNQWGEESLNKWKKQLEQKNGFWPPPLTMHNSKFDMVNKPTHKTFRREHSIFVLKG